MRTRILIPLIIISAGFFLIWGYQYRPQPAPAQAEPATPAAAAGIPFAPAADVQETHLHPQSAPMASSAAPSENAGAAPDDPVVEKNITRLEELAMNNDSDSLNVILLSLTDTNSLIREAALEATIQFDSPEAIPWLEAALAKLEIPREKENVLAAIDFLKLQPLPLNDGPNP